MHGELYQLKWNYSIVVNTPKSVKVKLWTKTKLSPYSIEKTLSIKDNESILYIEESITNLGNEDLHFIWRHHPAIGAPFLRDSCEIFTSAKKVFSPKIPCYDMQRIDVSSEHSWPIIRNRKGDPEDLSKVPSASSQIADMLFLKEFNGDAWYTIFNSELNIGF